MTNDLPPLPDCRYAKHGDIKMFGTFTAQQMQEYARAAMAQAHKPLTEEQIKAVIASIDPHEQYMPKALRQLARAIEAAHGIQGGEQ